MLAYRDGFTYVLTRAIDWEVCTADISPDVVYVESVRKLLSESAWTTLRKDLFLFHPPASNNCSAIRAAGIEHHDGSEYFRFNLNLAQLEGQTEDAKLALAEFKGAPCRLWAWMRPNSSAPLVHCSCSIITVAHRRNTFDPGDDLQNARWLRRCYGMASSHSGHHANRTS